MTLDGSSDQQEAAENLPTSRQRKAGKGRKAVPKAAKLNKRTHKEAKPPAIAPLPLAQKLVSHSYTNDNQQLHACVPRVVGPSLGTSPSDAGNGTHPGYLRHNGCLCTVLTCNG